MPCALTSLFSPPLCFFSLLFSMCYRIFLLPHTSALGFSLYALIWLFLYMCMFNIFLFVSVSVSLCLCSTLITLNALCSYITLLPASLFLLSSLFYVLLRFRRSSGLEHPLS